MGEFLTFKNNSFWTSKQGLRTVGVREEEQLENKLNTAEKCEFGRWIDPSSFNCYFLL